MTLTVNAGQRSSYTDTTINRPNIADAISIADPDDIPFIKLVGQNSAARVAGLTGIFNTKIEWIEDHLRPLTQVQTGATEWTNSTTTTSITVAEGAIFEKGMVIKDQASDELMYVVSTPTAETLTIARGLGSTTQTTHSSECTIEIVGVAMQEGSDPPDGISIVPSKPYNYTQIFEAAIKLTGTEQAISKYGYKNPFNYRRTNVMRELLIQLEKTCFWGRRAAGDGSTTNPRMMGGLPTFITNTVNVAGALTRKALEDEIQNRFEAVGAAYMPDTIICNGWVKRKITSFYEGSVRTERSERTGGTLIDRIVTEFGPMDISLNRWCPSSKLYIVRRSFIGVGAMDGRAFQYKELAYDGDRRKGHIFGEYTMVVKNADAHACLYGISVTS